MTSARAAASPSSKFVAKDVLATSDVRSSAASGDPRPLGGWYTADAADARGDISRDIVGVPAGTLAGTMSFIRSAEGESGGLRRASLLERRSAAAASAAAAAAARSARSARAARSATSFSAATACSVAAAMAAARATRDSASAAAARSTQSAGFLRASER